MRLSFFALVFTAAFLSWVLLAHREVVAQVQEKNADPTWESSLYEIGVRYEEFACSGVDPQVVSMFFLEHPLFTRRVPICHNDCPVIRCRPVIQIPSLARAAKVNGTVSVHILVDEEGKALYARVLDGHPLLLAAARRAACETQFNLYPHHKRQGVMHIYVDEAGFLGIPYTANEVPSGSRQ